MSYKMKHNKSAFPFKSPVKQQYDMNREQQLMLQSNQPGRLDLSYRFGSMAAGHGMRRKDQEPTPTPEEYEAQGLNRWGGTDLSI